AAFDIAWELFQAQVWQCVYKRLKMPIFPVPGEASKFSPKNDVLIRDALDVRGRCALARRNPRALSIKKT
ncbi:hypothetical protein, partial [Rhizobium sp. S163]|uniref:hypothetical protein n=1 Tax=Rhizobium sp. S163 TaxID=3055039 RepID=UPI0025A9D75A